MDRVSRSDTIVLGDRVSRSDKVVLGDRVSRSDTVVLGDRVSRSDTVILGDRSVTFQHGIWDWSVTFLHDNNKEKES